MSNLRPYSGILPVAPTSRAIRRAQRHAEGLALAAQIEQVKLHAIASATEYGMIRYTQVKRLQNDLEHLCPDAAEGLASFANSGLLDMLRSVQQFTQEIA